MKEQLFQKARVCAVAVLGSLAGPLEPSQLLSFAPVPQACLRSPVSPGEGGTVLAHSLALQPDGGQELKETYSERRRAARGTG